MLTIPDNALTVWSPEELADNLGISPGKAPHTSKAGDASTTPVQQ